MTQASPKSDRGMALQLQLWGLAGSLVKRTEAAHKPMAIPQASQVVAVISIFMAIDGNPEPAPRKRYC